MEWPHLSLSAARLPSAVLPWLTWKKSHSPPTQSLSLGEWNTTKRWHCHTIWTQKHTHTNKLTKTHTQAHRNRHIHKPIIRRRRLWRNYNLIQNRGKEGIYMENELALDETRERIILLPSLFFGPCSLFISLSLSLHGFNRALSLSSTMSFQREGIWLRSPEKELKWRSRNTKLCFKAIDIALCNYCTKYYI